MTAAAPDDVSSPDELPGIGPREAHDRQLALLAHQRRESEGEALRRLRRQRGDGVLTAAAQEVRRDQ
jgi:hypothetical protein